MSEAFRELVDRGDLEGVRAFLIESPGLASTQWADGSWPLHVAAERDDAAMVELLVRSGAVLDARFAGAGHSALSWAVTCWSFNAAKKLVELGDKPDLFCASGMGLTEHVRACWDGGVLRESPSRTGSTRYSDSGERLPCPPADDADQVSDALYIACRADRFEVAQWLLDHGADPNWRGYYGATCLAWAEFSENAELCALLRERGGSDELVDKHYLATPRVFPLMILAGWGFHPRKLYARFSADPKLVHARSEWGTLLHAAAQGGHTAVARLLIQCGVDRRAFNAQGKTAAQVAEEKGHSKLAAELE